MTETWAGRLRRFIDEHEASYGASWYVEDLEPLTRLASLLEQITPEGLLDAYSCSTCDSLTDEQYDSANRTLEALRALSTAPTEETEDR